MPHRTRTIHRLLLFVLTLVGIAASPRTSAQDDPAAGATGVLVGELELSADLFGLGNTARAGGWVGIRVQFRDNTDAPRDIALQIEMRDADGDRPIYRRVATANPGRRQQMWLYVYLPYRFDPSRGLRLTAREVLGEAAAASAQTDPQDAPTSRVDVRVGRLLAESAAMPGQLLADYEGMLGIIGDATHGLSLYASSLQGMNFAPLAHERTEVVTRIQPLDLPDRWMGLAPLEVLAWTNADPSELGPERARAVREWIERGGHLAIVLSVENLGPWTTSSNNLLRDLFPAVEVRATEGVDLEKYRPLLTRDPDLGLPRSVLVHTFEPLASAGPQEALRILDGPDGECIVARRIVGHGMVTVIGMGVGNRVLSNVGLPAADVFWNRVLGRRGQLEPLTRLGDLSKIPSVNLTNRADPSTIDRDIEGNINLEGQSLAGVVLAFAVFGLYWLVAGPGGFAVLKKAGRDRHAWLAFVGAAALFTAIAWGGATIIKPQRVLVRHITILDHVYGQEMDRARSWMSILVPSYLGAEVSVQSETLAAGVPRFYQNIAPWEGRPDAALGSSGGSFPDARPYEVESRAPGSLSVPTRATVKQFQVDWAGSPQLSWPTPSFTTGDGSDAITLDPVTRRPAGILTHNLPGPLTNVHIIVVRAQQGLRPHNRARWTRQQDGLAYLLSPSDQFFTDSIRATLVADWQPGTPLDLNVAFSTEGQNTFLTTWLDRGANSERDSLSERLTYASLFHQLALPSLNSGTASHRLERVATHGLDLSHWLSQPCVIVLGTLSTEGRDAMPLPVSVRIAGDDRTLYARGQTIVRWIFPLPSDTPQWPTAEEIQQALEELPDPDQERTRGIGPPDRPRPPGDR